MQSFDWSAVLSTVAGGGTVLLLAKLVLDRALADLDRLTREVNDVLVRLSAINVKLEVVERLRATVGEHERSLAVLEARSQLNGDHARRSSSNGAP